MIGKSGTFFFGHYQRKGLGSDGLDGCRVVFNVIFSPSC